MLSPRIFVRDYWILTPLVLSLGVWGFASWYLFSHLYPTSEQVFLHYNIIFGTDLVGKWLDILYFPLAGMAVMLVNFALALVLYLSEKFLARWLASLTVLLQIFLLVTIWLIVGLNV